MNSAAAELLQEAGDVAIEIRDLHVTRPQADPARRLAEDPPGSVTGLLGPSGSGKTTLMRAIVGVQIVPSGTVTVLGQPAGTPALRRRVAYVTQAPSVYADLTVEENLRYFARILAAPQERIAELIGLVGLTGQTKQVTRTLSGGKLSRASLAVALLRKPELSCSTSRPSTSTRSSAASSGRPSTRLADVRRQPARLQPRDGRGRPLPPARC